MENLIGKAVIVMTLIGLLSTGATQCSIDMVKSAKFLRGVGGSMLGTSNSEAERCANGICIDTPIDRPTVPGQRN